MGFSILGLGCIHNISVVLAMLMLDTILLLDAWLDQGYK